MPRRIGKKSIISIALALIIVVSTGAAAFFTDRVDHSMQFTTASFNADGYKLTRVAPEGPFCAGEDVTATLKESNSGEDGANSIISMKATWVSPDTTLSIFGNANSADNATLSIGGQNVAYTVSSDKKSITFDLPKQVLAAGTKDKARDLTLTIPASFKSTGRIDFTFEKVVVAQEGGGFSNEYNRTDLNASGTLDYSVKAGWAASSLAAQSGKALMAYLTDKNSSGKYGIEFEFAFNYSESPMKDFASRTDAKWSYYKGAVDSLTFVEGMTSIGDYAFPDFSGVKSVSFPASVETIGQSAFDASGLTGEVSIPATVKEIKSLAFGNLPNVKTFTFSHTSRDSLKLPDNTAAGKRNTGAFYVPTHVDTTVSSSVEAILYGYKWHDGYDNRWAAPTLKAQDAWFRTGSTAKLDENALETITFADYHMPVTGETSWDASDPSAPGTVTAFLSADKTSLILAGNGYGKIFANTDSTRAFNGFSALTKFSGLDKLDTSRVTAMQAMFGSLDSIRTLDLSSFHTEKVKSFRGIFSGDKNLTALDLTGWDTAAATDMSEMFSGCTALASLDLSNFNTVAVTKMTDAFDSCRKLQTVTLGKDFKFIGTDGYLPAPSSAYIPKADGKWYVAGFTKCYTPAELAAVTRVRAVTYSAIPGTDPGTSGGGSGGELEMDVRYPVQSGTLTYNGSAQSPSWSGYDAAKLTIGGTTSGTNAGSYTATFTPKAGYCWIDGTADTVSVTWKIEKAAGSLTLSKSSATIDYNAATTTFTVTRAGDGAISATSNNTNVAAVSVSGTTVTVTKKAAGSATITVKVAETANYKAPADKTCAITCIGSLTVPAQSGTLTYNGSTQSPAWNSNYATAKMTLGGTTSGTNAGSYTATFTPKTNYKWSDGTSAAKNVTWSIGKADGSVTLSKSSATIDYNAATTTFTVTRTGDGAISATSSNTGVATVSVSGSTVTVTKKGAGTATITVKAAEGTNHKAASKTCAITCVGSLTVPSQSGTLTYTGSAQSPSWNSNYAAAKMTLGGTTSGTNAGSYTATFTPKANYKWSDGTTTAKSVTWKIGKAAGSLSLSTSTMTIGTGSGAGSFTVTRAGNGAISASSNNTGVATVSVSGNTVTVTKKTAGTAIITVSVAAGTNHTAPASKTCTVTCKAGTAIGSLPVGSSVYMNVSGVRKEFLVVNQGNPNTSIYDSSCNGTWLLMKDVYEQRAFNTSDAEPLWPSDFAYENSDKYSINTHLNSTFLARFDADVQAIIKPVQIPYFTGFREDTGSGGHVASGANGLSQKIFLLSGTEVGCVNDGTPDNEGAKLSYFKDCSETDNDSKRIAYMNGTAVKWWLRSPPCRSNGQAYVQNALIWERGGSWNGMYGKNELGVRPALLLPSATLVDDDRNVMASESAATLGLDAPAMTLTNSSDGHPTISWAKVSGATQYEIYRSTDNKTFSIIRRTAALTYTDTTAAAGTTYYYKVRSMNDDTYSAFCTAQCFLGAPTMKLTNAAGGEPVISWAKVDGAAQYEIYRSTTGAAGSYKIIRRTAALTYIDTMAEAGTTYYYVVRSMNGSTYSAFCAAQSIQCKAG